MSDCIRETIAQKIATRLGTVTTANGYAVELGTVTRPLRRGLDQVPEHLGVILEQGQAERVEAGGAALGTEHWQQAWTAIVVLRPPDGSDTSWSGWVNAVEAAVRKAFYKDRTLGGYAITLVVGAPGDVLAEDGSWEGTEIDVIVEYRTDEDDPYSLPS